MFIIPLAGDGQRFKDAGYKKIKPQLTIFDKSLFFWSISSFHNYNDNEFVFITRKEHCLKEFIKLQCQLLSINNYSIFELKNETKGQAETVYSYTKYNTADHIFIFNIDTVLTNFSIPSWIGQYDGYLEYFINSSPNFSYIDLNCNNVTSVQEKKVISKNASNGFYYFKNSSIFNLAYENYSLNNFFIGPLYNYLIANNYKIRGNKISNKELIILGTPDDFGDEDKKLKLFNYGKKNKLI